MKREEPLNTPFGRLYPPKSMALQIPFLIAAFAGGPVVAWLIGKLLGDVSQNAQMFLYVLYTSIFFFGYALWASRLATLAFNTFGKQILRVLFQWLVKRQRPQKVQELLPTREKLEELVVRAQRAASSFVVVAVALALLGAIAAILMQTQSSRWLQSVLVGAGCTLWGWLLTFLGRRGYLPLPEANE